MKKALLLLLGFSILLVKPIFAEEGWEAALMISILNAENKLCFGQKPDATDGIDGFYDGPAFLSGDIKAYFLLGEGKYWRDIRASGSKEWVIIVEAELKGEKITLGWNPKNLPRRTGITLMDDTEKKAVDMKTSNGYSYQNNGPRQFRVVLQQ